ncbi:hypothetical protein G3I59_45215 [Amycolatopsis rubida]|uniref:DUF320 domain-containing protein n=1 Tax=Amycolatopsis rubida TaxID=112413 RepID=A0ABX0C8F3_9PSEU|nr:MULTISPECIES: hypothetical protein [Amycolatopsis]MYW97628.1 hypothetical protein [Amycolatopsis rubida]NEC62613.1 hypothetical protein [Amycolatopsis rubida]OAP21798.1 hypothetical protein A4R44_07255 [Amycolatopsis sp. M39]
MLKKIGFATGAVAAGILLFGGTASAGTPGPHHGADGQAGLANLDNTDVLHTVNATLGLCGNDVNVLGVQVPVRHSLDGIGVPVLSPGANKAAGQSPYNCAAGAVTDGGSVQHH